MAKVKKEKLRSSREALSDLKGEIAPSPPPNIKVIEHPIDGMTETLIESDLLQPVENDNQFRAASKELFNEKDIDTKTELSHDDITGVTKLRFLEERYGVRNIPILVNSLLTLRISKNRKSREEFIESLQAERRSKQGGSIMDKFKGMFNGGGQ